MKSLQITKKLSVFSKRSMLACMIAGGILSLNSCGKHSMEGIDLSSIEPSRPAILTKVPAPVLKDMEVFTGMNNNSQKRVEAYLKKMTPAKEKTISLFKDVNVFGNLPQNEQYRYYQRSFRVQQCERIYEIC